MSTSSRPSEAPSLAQHADGYYTLGWKGVVPDRRAAGRPLSCSVSAVLGVSMKSRQGRELARKLDKPATLNVLRAHGSPTPFFLGVEDCFARIVAHARERGFALGQNVISSGNEEGGYRGGGAPE